jgi:DNA gyrase subunit A
MVCVNDIENETIMVVSENGYGKRSAVEDYRITNRGGKGVKTMNVTDKTGKLIAIKSVIDENDLMIINKSGIAIRMDVSEIRVMGRATQGVRLINLKGKDTIAAVAKVEISSEDQDLGEDEIDETIDGETPETGSESPEGNE